MHLALCSLLASPSPGCSVSWPVWTRRTVAVACTKLILMVTLHFVLCSLPRSASPGCSSSWPVWTRWTVSSSMAVACARRVLLVTLHLALFSRPGSQAHARHHGLSGPKRTVAVSFTMLVLLVTMHLALCSLVCRPMMLDIMAVMDQKDSHVLVPWSDCRKLWSLRSCSLSLVVDISFAVQRQSFMVQTVRQTIDFLQLLYKVVDVPVCRSCRFPCRGAEAYLMVQPVWTIVILQLHFLDMVINAPVVQVYRFPVPWWWRQSSSHSCHC